MRGNAKQPIVDRKKMLNLTSNQRIQNGDDNEIPSDKPNSISLCENVKKWALLYIAGGGVNFSIFGKLNCFSIC